MTSMRVRAGAGSPSPASPGALLLLGLSLFATLPCVSAQTDLSASAVPTMTAAATTTTATVKPAAPSKPPHQHGLIGYGIDMYMPACAFACQRVLSRSRLNCSTDAMTGAPDSLGFDTSNACTAADDAFLFSLAYCLERHCEASEGATGGQEDWVVMRYWEDEVLPDGPRLKYEYQDALRAIKMAGGPQVALMTGQPLSEPSLVNQTDFDIAERSMVDLAWTEVQHSTYALLLLASMILLPLLLNLLHVGAAAVSADWERFLLARLIYPAVFRQRHFVARLLGEPTGGEALLIATVLLINAFFSLVGFRHAMPNIFFQSDSEAASVLFANRLGVLAFANLAIVVLYAARSNPLLHLTSWDYPTFMLLHRWTAYACFAQVLGHSFIFLTLNLHVLTHKFTQAYWPVGIAGTLAMCLLVPLALPSVRRRYYSLFADVHVVLALVTLTTCYYHIYCKFGHHWGYENWVVLAGVIWLGERIARAVKMALNGMHTARVREVDDEYFVVDVEGVRGTGMAYLYFPTAGWRKWENHPFSIMASVVQKRSNKVEKMLGQDGPMFDLVGSDSEDENEDEDDNHDEKNGGRRRRSRADGDDLDAEADETAAEKTKKLPRFDKRRNRESQGLLREPSTHHPSLSSTSTILPPSPRTPKVSKSTAMTVLNDDPLEDDDDEEADLEGRGTTGGRMVSGLSFLVRRERGLTARIFTDASRAALPVLVEGPYASHQSLSGTHSLSATAAHVVCIAGGVGIAAVLPLVLARAAAGSGRTALYFGTRSEGLRRTCGLDALQRDAYRGLDIRVRVGERWDLQQVVWREAGCDHQGDRGKTAGRDVWVVVCGPPAMVADARAAVVEANRRIKRGVVRFVDECFSW